MFVAEIAHKLLVIENHAEFLVCKQKPVEVQCSRQYEPIVPMLALLYFIGSGLSRGYPTSRRRKYMMFGREGDF